MRCRNCATRDDDGRIEEFGRHNTVEEARECSGVPNPREARKDQTFARNGIKTIGLNADDFTKSGLTKVADIFSLDSSGTKSEIADRIREVL